MGTSQARRGKWSDEGLFWCMEEESKSSWSNPTPDRDCLEWAACCECRCTNDKWQGYFDVFLVRVCRSWNPPLLMWKCCRIWVMSSMAWRGFERKKRNSLNSISLFSLTWIQSVQPFGVINAICLAGFLALKLFPISCSSWDLSSVFWTRYVLSLAFVINRNWLHVFRAEFGNAVRRLSRSG